MNGSLPISKDADHMHSLGYLCGYSSNFVGFLAFGIYFLDLTTFKYENEMDEPGIGRNVV